VVPLADLLKVDAGLVSLMLIILITSGMVVLTLAHEKVESPVLVLKNTYPPRLYTMASVTSKEKMDFSFSVTARRRIGRLQIQYSTLAQGEPVFVGEKPEGASPEDIGLSITPISELFKWTENEQVPNEIIPVEVKYGNRTLEGAFFDFPMLRMFTAPDLSGLVFTSFLVLKNNTDVLYFEGISDFFFNRLGGFVEVELPEGVEVRSSIESMRIRRNNNVTSFSSAPELPAGWKPIEDLPSFGTIGFSDVEEDETFSIDFTIDTPKRPRGLIAQVVRVYADGDLVEIVVNLIE